MATMTEERNVPFYLILIDLSVNSPTYLVATMLESTVYCVLHDHMCVKTIM